MSVALVPVKRLAAGKSRLAASLGRDAAERLTRALLSDVVAALAGVARIERVVVVTPDAEVGEAARAAGAEALVRQDPGLNESLDAAAAELGEASLLVVLGDVAGALAADIEALYTALDGLGGRGVVLAPSSDGGTSALLRAPHDLIPNRFGKESAAAHRAAARAAGVALAELPLDSLAVDLDTVEDAEALLSCPGAPHTRALLAELGVGRRA